MRILLDEFAIASTRRTDGGVESCWVAEVQASVGTPIEYATGASEAEALGNLLIKLRSGHDERCRRPFHSGPCVGVLRVEHPVSSQETFHTHCAAVAAVLERKPNRGRYGWELARDQGALEEIMAAADTGI